MVSSRLHDNRRTLVQWLAPASWVEDCRCICNVMRAGPRFWFRSVWRDCLWSKTTRARFGGLGCPDDIEFAAMSCSNESFKPILRDSRSQWAHPEPAPNFTLFAKNTHVFSDGYEQRSLVYVNMYVCFSITAIPGPLCPTCPMTWRCWKRATRLQRLQERCSCSEGDQDSQQSRQPSQWRRQCQCTGMGHIPKTRAGSRRFAEMLCTMRDDHWICDLRSFGDGTHPW